MFGKGTWKSLGIASIKVTLWAWANNAGEARYGVKGYFDDVITEVYRQTKGDIEDKRF